MVFQDLGRMNWSRYLSRSVVWLGLSVWGMVTAGFGFDLQMELKSPSPQIGGAFGSGVAVNDRYLVVCEMGATAPTGETGAGAVHLFRATDGRYMRRLNAPVAMGSGAFGGALSLHGSSLLVGNQSGFAAGEGAWIFDLARPGKAPRGLVPTSAEVGEKDFGREVLLVGQLAVVGAPLEAGGRGAVYVYDASNGQQLARLVADDEEAGWEFGGALALDGGLLFVGAPGAAANDGACYVFAVAGPNPSFSQITKLQPATSGQGARYGAELAAGGNRLLVGEPLRFSEEGAVTVYRLSDLNFLLWTELQQAGGRYGGALAVYGGKALIGAAGVQAGSGLLELLDLDTYDFDFQTVGSAGSGRGGSVALFENVALSGEVGRDVDGVSGAGVVTVFRAVGLETMRTHAVQGQLATGGGTYARLESPVTGHQGDVIFESTLSPVPAPGVTRGLFASLGGGDLRLLARRDPVPAAFESASATVERFGRLLLNRSQRPLMEVTLTGASQQARSTLFGSVVDVVSPILLGGYPIAEVNGSALSSIRSLHQSRTAFGVNETYAGIGYRLPRSAQTGVGSANDSGFMVVNQSLSDGVLPPVMFDLQEGDVGPEVGDVLGQMDGPFAFSGTILSCVAPVLNAGSVRSAFLNYNPTGELTAAVNSTRVPGGLANGSFRRLTAVANASTSFSAFRATITGSTLLGQKVTSANNEGFWGPSNALILRKGDEIDGLPGVTLRRFLGVWMMNASSEMLVLAQVRGPGVTSRNAVALWQRLSNGVMIPLVREGDVLPLADAPAVRRILRVDSVGNHYSVLVSLTGNSGRNQALLVGLAKSPNVEQSRAQRVAHLLLRKGMAIHSAAGSETVLRSMTMLQAIDKSGSGATGGSRAVSNSGRTALKVRWDRKDAICVQRP
jgi:hypothetical protein